MIHIEDILPAGGTTAFLADEVRNGWVTLTRNPDDESLAVLCYGKLVQIKAHWDARSTLLTRGLIVRLNEDDKNDLGLAGATLVSRGMRKFFTIDQTSHYGVVLVDDDEGVQISGSEGIDFSSPAIVSDKLDGALGIGYVLDGRLRLSTKASFTSDEAIVGSRVLSEHFDTAAMGAAFSEGGEFENYTPLFEIISKDVDHIVNYGDMDDTVFLGLMEKRSGIWHPAAEALPSRVASLFGLTVPEVFDAHSLDEALTIPEISNREGFVVTVNGDGGAQTMYKVKFPKFLALQRIKHSIDSARVQKQIIRDAALSEVFSKSFRISDTARERAKELAEIEDVEHLFDDLVASVDSAAEKSFLAPMRELLERSLNDFGKVPMNGDRKAAALAIQEFPKDEVNAMFAMMNAAFRGEDEKAAAQTVIRTRFVGRG